MYHHATLPKSMPCKDIGLGNCQDRKAKLVFNTIRKSPLPHFAVEIGVHYASSLVFMGAAVKGQGTCIGIDPYAPFVQQSLMHAQRQVDKLDHDEIHESANSFVKKYALSECTKIVRSTSEQYAAQVPACITFLHIDGHHDYEYVKKDIELYSPKVVVGGYILCDDTSFPQVAQAVDESLSCRTDQWERVKIFVGNMRLFQRV